ncbi:MAG: SEL1-like repeat protein, partial [Rhodospirillaceae bacterium]|nr:SEL1-like repeat protein [Rhodospirillaceae bacterium]
GTPRDIVQAREWYIRAADAGEARAMNNLGFIYEKGLLGVRDYGKAVVWYRRAARTGLAIAQSNLAALHYLGRGVPRDFEQAYRWYNAAAVQGDALGQNGLGLLYANGLGVERDLIRAMAWFSLAAHAEGPAGEDAVNYRDRLSRLMSPQERARADTLSTEFLAQADAAEDAAEEPAFGVALPRPANGFRDSAIYAQRLLKTLGYYDASVDGVAGELTIRATAKFLRENGLRMAPQITRDLVEALEEVREDRIAEAAAAAAAEEAARQESIEEPADELVEHEGQGQS